MEASCHDSKTVLLSVPEVAERLSCSTRTVKRRIADGSLPEVRIGVGQRDRRVSLAALAEFIEARTVTE